MRSQEWVKKFEALLEKHEDALMRFMEIPAHQLLIRDSAFEVLVATRRALINFARSDGEVTDDRP